MTGSFRDGDKLCTLFKERQLKEERKKERKKEERKKEKGKRKTNKDIDLDTSL